MLDLREHQQDVVERLREGFKAGHKRQLLYAPTGFGKTEVAMYLMKAVADNRKRAAMVLDRIVLVEQTSQRLSKYDIDHGVMQSQHWRWRPYERLQVCSVQTLERRKDFPDFDLIIVDECHVSRAATNKWILNNPDVNVIGLTATPFTAGLGNVYTHVVSGMPTQQLIEKKWLSPLRVYICKEIDMLGVKKVAGEFAANDVSERGMQITGDIVAEWIKKTHDVFGGPRKTIVFCAGVDHGRDLERQFKDQGYNFVSISYKEDDEFKRQTIEDFARPDTNIHGLIATDILTRGFDVPDVVIGVSARPFSKSLSSHVQQMGRVMRPHDSKQFALWLDHSGNFLRFREDWDRVYAEGVHELSEQVETTKKEPTEKEKKESICPKCQALMAGSECSQCDYVRPARQTVISVPGEMVELGENVQQRDVTRLFYAELMTYARQKGYKLGWAAHKYKERYGVFPPKDWNADSQRQVSLATTGWLRSRNIAYAKAKAKRAA